MASCRRTLNRFLIVVLLATSLALAIVGVFMPFFTRNYASTSGATASLTSGAHLKKGSMSMWEVTFTHENRSAYPDIKSELRSDFFTCRKGKTSIQIGEGFAVVTCVLCCANLLLSIFTFFFSAVVRVPLAVYAFLAASCAGVTVGVLVHGYLHAWCPHTSPSAAAQIALMVPITASSSTTTTTIAIPAASSSSSGTASTVSTSSLSTLRDSNWKVSGAGLPLFAASAACSLASSLMAAIGG